MLQFKASEATTTRNQFTWISVQVSKPLGLNIHARWDSRVTAIHEVCGTQSWVQWVPVGPVLRRHIISSSLGNVAPDLFQKSTRSHGERTGDCLRVTLGWATLFGARGVVLAPLYEQKPTNHCVCEIFALDGSGARLPNFLLLLLYRSMVPLQSFYYIYFYLISFCF